VSCDSGEWNSSDTGDSGEFSLLSLSFLHVLFDGFLFGGHVFRSIASVCSHFHD
jgi:hypothetical protein